MVTQQGAPKGWKQDNTFGFQAMGKMKKPLTHWLRNYFLDGTKPDIFTGGQSNLHVYGGR